MWLKPDDLGGVTERELEEMLQDLKDTLGDIDD